MSAISFRPSTFAQGGGLVDDVDVEIVRARFGFGYGGNSSAEDATTFHLTLKDGDGTEYVQYYGTGTGFVPSEAGDAEENGKELVPVDSKTAVSGSSNFAMLITSMVNAGLPEDLLDSGDISQLEGVKGHVNRVPAPKRDGLPKREGKNADRPQTVLVFTTITDFPGNAAAKPKAGAKPGTKSPAAAAPAKGAPATTKPTPAAKSAISDELKEELEGELIGLFAAKEATSMKKIDLTKGLFSSIDNSNPNKKVLIASVSKDEVLSSLDNFSFDGKELSQNE